MKLYSFLSLFLLVIIGENLVQAQSLYPGQQRGKLKIDTQIQLKASGFDLKDVRLLDSPFKENMQRESKWLLSLNADQLLYTFRLYAGINTSKPKVELGGWESFNVELRGHSTGHVLSGLALMYASTGEPIYKIKGDSLVAGLSEVQKTLNRDGYLSAFPENLIDRVIAGKPVWAPWYTLHKIFAGLEDMYLYAGSGQALDIAKGMSDWAYKKLSPLSKKQLAVMQKIEFGGIAETFYNLYSITGNTKDLKLAEMFYHSEMLDPLVEGKDQLKDKHGNTFVPKVIAEARAYELTGNDKDKNIALNFWNIIVNGHSFVTGGNDDQENFFEPDHQSEHLTGHTSETCNVYNMLKLTRHLFTWTADEKYACFYERALYNHILGSQDPHSSMVCYFMPLEPGAFKLYSTETNSFWCCVGSGFENHAKYGEGIYYHDDKGVFVNLFIPSVLSWDVKGIKLVQETKFPEEPTTKLTVQCSQPVEMPLYLRYPSWASKGVSVKVNGKSIKISGMPGTYLTLARKWNNDDRIEISYPMSLKLFPTPDNPSIAAVTYGPIVLAGPMGTEGMVSPAPFSNPNVHNDYYNYNYNVPASLSNILNVKESAVEDWLKQVPGIPLTYKTVKTLSGKDYKLIPLYNLHHERYVVYWNLK
jgi:DUF1680 family protein